MSCCNDDGEEKKNCCGGDCEGETCSPEDKAEDCGCDADHESEGDGDIPKIES